MQLFRTLAVLVISTGPLLPMRISAQKHKSPVNALFSDLPLDAATDNSILADGETGTEKIKKNIFIIGTLSKSVCYSGESLLLTYQLYSALQSKSQVTLRPDLAGFNVEERSLNNEHPLPEQKGGRDFRVFTVWQVLLNPYRSGKLTIDPLTAANEVRYTVDGETRAYSGFTNSNALSLTVLPLPPYRGREAFSGGIGEFGVSAFVRSKRVPAGEVDTLCLEIEGAGNLNAIAFPPVKWPAGVESFPSKEQWVAVKNSFPPRGKRIVSIPFVAHDTGNISVASLFFSYFDPSVKSYRDLQTGAVALEVDPPLKGNTKAKPVVSPPGLPKGPENNWILWPLGAMAISLIAFWQLRKRSHPYMGSPAGEADMGSPAEDSDMGSSIADSDMGLPAGEPRALTWQAQLAELRMVHDMEHYIVMAREILSGYLRKCWWPRADLAAAGEDTPSAVALLIGEEDELLEMLHRHTQDVALVEDVRGFYTRCDRLLYAPADLTEVDASLAAMISLIIERCEIHKNINISL